MQDPTFVLKLSLSNLCLNTSVSRIGLWQTIVKLIISPRS